MARTNAKPMIKPQWRPKIEQFNCKLDTETIVRLKAYCDFIQSEQSYVIREVLNYLFAHDEQFQEYLRRNEGAHSSHPPPTEPEKSSRHSSSPGSVHSKATASAAPFSLHAAVAHENEKH